MAIVLLVVLTVAASILGRLGIAKASVIAAVRAIVQLGIVSIILVYALAHMWAALLFTVFMFAIAVRTTANRSGVSTAWVWAAVAMLAGVLPVLLIIFATGCAPLTPVSLVPVSGIIIGNIMSGHTLACRRFFADLREEIGTYEAGLAVGFPRRDAIALVTEPSVTESVLPTVDRTATVGLVTLPGAFVGVLLGGGSALQAGAAQALVLIGILAGQAVTVVVAHDLVTRAKLLPEDLATQLHP
ncbi:ABC transporter permease [Cutibacterium sp. WCA-380-WT-3A]|uniref:ABC transporter permease n=1 Tax=Cutibacterium porci TaxID=2605781 RepID=A0A7K0J6V0_9ACTN|nr:ABC transporter permease [Cutibacterium porci]MSS45690.1 ABC transporter permease [Cutibacterium porci]